MFVADKSNSSLGCSCTKDMSKEKQRRKRKLHGAKEYHKIKNA